jgi:hypothetical protein
VGDGVKKFDGRRYALEVFHYDGHPCHSCAGNNKTDLCLALCSGAEPHCVTSPGKVWKPVKGGSPCTK